MTIVVMTSSATTGRGKHYVNLAIFFGSFAILIWLHPLLKVAGLAALAYCLLEIRELIKTRKKESS